MIKIVQHIAQCQQSTIKNIGGNCLKVILLSLLFGPTTSAGGGGVVVVVVVVVGGAPPKQLSPYFVTFEQISCLDHNYLNKSLWSYIVLHLQGTWVTFQLGKRPL